MLNLKTVVCTSSRPTAVLSLPIFHLTSPKHYPIHHFPKNYRKSPHRRTTAAAAFDSPEPPEPSSPPNEPNPLFTGLQPTIILAGFYLEELPAVRHLLDVAGGQNITLVPCMPWLLELPLDRVIAEGEPKWDQPMPPTWVQGGGWGRKRVALFNDISSLAMGTIKSMLASSPAGDVGCMAVNAEDSETLLGYLLGRALEDAPESESDPLDFIESADSLPPLDAMLDEVLTSGAADGGEAENSREEEELIEMPEPDVDEELLIDSIAAELLQDQR